MRFHAHVKGVALFVLVWNRRTRFVLLNVWGRTPIFYRRELT